MYLSVNQQPRGNGLLVLICLIVVLSAGGFMFWGYQTKQNSLNTVVAPPPTEVRGTKIGEPVTPVPIAPTNATVSTVIDATPAALAAPTNNAANLDPSKLEKVKTGEGHEYLTVGFDYLSGFEYVIPEEGSTNAVTKADASKDQIPKTVRSLNNQRVALKGFMLPLKVEGGLITELLVMRDQSMCCYGSVPKINEWVSVKMTSKGVKPIMDQAVTLYGKLKVGEIRENGYLVGIYEMDGESMAGPLDL
ncbi:MAG: hypothetical protein K0Q55_234 [Verrucomicrobia bacterium]|jgi:hypothetical protein|nr:hypothetical protein [Verrucomicrobiota bacterium]